MIFIVILLGLIAIYSLTKWFIYYCATRGLLYYLETTHNDMPNSKKVKELISMAIKRTIKEFLGKN
ncbi:hypothetical protein [Clostridium botulinum]|uniref:hypothetical protein n=1 Tax=Clostridium botulinum TaxID=1491 RepID=UPI00059BAA52|nr:hypothetical protein [Clostridium botulinum]KIN81950.1 hypothetical protein SD74_07220 [Clostridium botulinum]MCC5428180.1 hypothetical protein [Clostridium botulinum]